MPRTNKRQYILGYKGPYTKVDLVLDKFSSLQNKHYENQNGRA